MKTRYASGMAESYAGGRKRVRKINADELRVRFAKKLATYDGHMLMTGDEITFIQRILLETDGKTVYDLHDGDCNIIDSLRRKYEGRLP